MTQQRYVKITIEEFDEWARENNFSGFDASSIKLLTFEKVYFRSINDKARIIIFSSLDLRDSLARDVGTDAIRACIFLRTEAENNTRSWFNYIQLSRVYRTKNWRENLSKRIEEGSIDVSKELCPKCNNPLVLRRGKFGPFYSCVMWPKTQCDGKGKFNE